MWQKRKADCLDSSVRNIAHKLHVVIWYRRRGLDSSVRNIAHKHQIFGSLDSGSLDSSVRNIAHKLIPPYN